MFESQEWFNRRLPFLFIPLVVFVGCVTGSKKDRAYSKAGLSMWLLASIGVCFHSPLHDSSAVQQAWNTHYQGWRGINATGIFHLQPLFLIFMSEHNRVYYEVLYIYWYFWFFLPTFFFTNLFGHRVELMLCLSNQFYHISGFFLLSLCKWSSLLYPKAIMAR